MAWPTMVVPLKVSASRWKAPRVAVDHDHGVTLLAHAAGDLGAGAPAAG